MRTVSLLPAMALAVALASPTPAAEWEQSPLGSTAIVPMTSAPYPHLSRENGWTRSGRTWPLNPHYIDSTVGLFVPADFKATETFDVVVYFHGHGNNVRKAFDQFKLREQIVASGRNAILVFPQGPRDASDSGIGKLEDPDGLKNLLDETTTLLKADGRVPANSTLGAVTLTGHSGAYKAIGLCLKHGGVESHIREVYLLDASYGLLEEYTAWIQRTPEGRFASIYTEHLADENLEIQALLTKAEVPFLVQAQEKLDDATRRSARVLFVPTTTLNHNDTVSTLEGFLKAGAPAPLPTPTAAATPAAPQS